MHRRTLLTRGALALGSAAWPSILLRAQSVGPVMSALSAYMAAAKDRALPADVAEKAKHHILDTFAAMIPAPSCRPAAPRWRWRARRPAVQSPRSSARTS